MSGKYTVLRPLNKGGMGAIYLASETIANAQRQVVIKEMLDYFDPNDPQGAAKAQKRFETEAATLVTLNFPGIPQIFAYFSENGRHYIVMQFIQGKDLESGLTHVDDVGNLVSGKPYPAEEVRRWGVQVCKVLENLASQNVVHMDIKPANLIVDAGDNVWLVDFGTAKAKWGVQSRGKVGMQKSSIYGTAGYAPPEQAKGQAEPRSDVFALAATLYHLFTDDDPGQNPYTFAKINQLPREITQALKPALEKDAKRRIHAAEFRRLLDTRSSSNVPFRWQDGTVAYEPRDLVASADRLWDEARSYFTGDAWIKWFKDLHRHDLPNQMQRIKNQITDPDLALDAFIRSLDPGFPLPKMQISPPDLNLGVVPWQQRCTADLTVTNLGSGCLRGTFVQTPPGLKVNPSGFSTHTQQTIQVTVDSGALTPSAQPYLLPLTIDADQAGLRKLPITVTVPEPKLAVGTNLIELGKGARGEKLNSALQVSNSGKSPFFCEVHSDKPWLIVKSPRFICDAGKQQQVKLIAQTDQLKLGNHTTLVTVHARANDWDQVELVQAIVSLPWHKNFIKYWAPPLGWLAIWTLFGFCFGWVIGWLANIIHLPASEIYQSIIFGGMVGVFACAGLGALIGAIAGFGGLKGKPGARRGAILATILGALTGAISGPAFQVFLGWIGMQMVDGGLTILGALVGAFAALCLGACLWRLAEV